MWLRRTYHECACELIANSEVFRTAYTNSLGWDISECQSTMRAASIKCVELLQILAAAIRNDQDYDLTPRPTTRVGSIISNAAPEDVTAVLNGYRPPYGRLNGSAPLSLRDALNKIIHPHPTRNGFFVDETAHDLILCGEAQNRREWIAVISLVGLCDIINSLPDRAVP